MTNELSANLDQPLTLVPPEGTGITGIDKALTTEVTDGDSETINTTLQLTDGVSAQGAGTALLQAETTGDAAFGDLEDVTDTVTADQAVTGQSGAEAVTVEVVHVDQDAGTDVPDTDRVDQARQDVESALSTPQTVSERNANIRAVAAKLASLSPEDRAQHPDYRGGRQDGGSFSDIRFTHDDREYIALTPYNDSLRREFEQRVAGLSWEGIDTPPPGVETGVTYTDAVGEEMIICNPAAGKPTYCLSNEEIRAIPDDHLEGMVAFAEYHANRGNMIDCIGNNFFYDQKVGFTVIDCEPAPPEMLHDAEMIFGDFIVGVAGYEDILAFDPTNDRFLAKEELRMRAKAIQQRQWGPGAQPKGN